jgi:anaerobic ribonucleoside-triphosphate reductase activating protein
VAVTRHWGSEEDATLRISRLIDRTAALGPGERAVVVVQGCHLRCRGCISSATHALDGGTVMSVEAIGRRLAGLEVDGVTFSGGEPFLQAAAISSLIDLLRRERPGLSTMSYSGYRLEWLRSKGSRAQHQLLERLDLLVDGPYVRRQHAALRWRGSHNQRLHALTPRHRREVEDGKDSSAGVEIKVDDSLELDWVGVPPVPDFEARLARVGAVKLTTRRRGRRLEARR